MDYRLALMTGIDIPIPEFQVNIHQPTIKEISYIGEEDFFSALQYLTINKSHYRQDQLLNSISNFEIFITVINESQVKEQKQNIITLLTILFPNYKTIITPQSIILNSNNGTLIIDENNFDIIQKYVKDIFCLNSSMHESTNFNPKGKKAQEIADKIMKGRKKISEEKGEEKESFLSKYLSILAIGCQYNLLDLVNLTIYQLYDLIERYNLYTNWDIDIRIKLAGGKNDNKPDNWMRNIH